MLERKPSTVAAYLRSRGGSPATAWTGGRGRQGPLGAWLLREKAAILAGRSTVPALTWREVADLAAADGIRRPDGSPYPERQVARAWASLVARKRVPRATDAGAARPAVPMPPSPAVSPGAVPGSGAAAREPAFTANSLLPVKRFGGRRG